MQAIDQTFESIWKCSAQRAMSITGVAGRMTTQAQRFPLEKLVHDRLSQREMAPEHRMVGVVQEFVVEDPVAASAAQDLRAVNQNTGMPARPRRDRFP